MKTLALLLLPFVCLAGDSEGAIDLARAAPAEFAADALIRIAAMEHTPKARKLALLQEAYERAGGAQHPYKLRSAIVRLGGPAGFLNRAYLQDLDALSLRLRAIQTLLPLDPKLARDLFEQLPPLDLPDAGCERNQAYDVSPFYAVLGSVAGEGAPRLLDRYMAAISSPAQVGPAARMLARAGLTESEFRSAVTAFAGALRRVGADDRSFTLSNSGADILALVEACRNRGIPPVMVVDAFRQYLVAHLAGERCADNAQAQGNSINAGLAKQQPAADTASANAVQFFNEKLRVPPVKAIETYETYPSKAETAAITPPSCEDAACKSVLEHYRKLIFSGVGVAYSAADRARPEWRDQLPALLDELAQWNESEGASPLASFAAKCSFYNDLAGMVVNAADREAVYRGMLDFLSRSSLRTADRVAWFLPLNGLIGRAAMDPAGFGRTADLLANSSDPIIALYWQLEKLAPRTADRILALL